MNVLILYNSTQTFTNTVYEHLASFGEYSSHRVFFAHADQISKFNINLNAFDAVGIHFTIRLPFDQISISTALSLTEFKGLKFLFIQDEYDFPKRVWQWINRLGIRLVFTVVPEAGIEVVYPREEFPNTRFVTNLTGYVPEKLPPTHELPPPSRRELMFGYRGRPLPIRYGQLGVEKISVGALVKDYCGRHGISNDIAWSEESRIYGPDWYEFVVSCRSMLGSESGSNVFDWDGDLAVQIERYKDEHPHAVDEDIFRDLIEPREMPGLMNQLSPRVFEAIASRTVLVLFEGEYSGVINPWEHYIPLKKDGSNIAEVVEKLSDNEFVDQLATDAYSHVIASGKYSYQSFVFKIDEEISKEVALLRSTDNESCLRVTKPFLDASPGLITTSPIRSAAPVAVIPPIARNFAMHIWSWTPEVVRSSLRPFLKKLLQRR